LYEPIEIHDEPYVICDELLEPIEIHVQNKYIMHSGETDYTINVCQANLDDCQGIFKPRFPGDIYCVACTSPDNKCTCTNCINVFDVPEDTWCSHCVRTQPKKVSLCMGYLYDCKKSTQSPTSNFCAECSAKWKYSVGGGFIGTRIYALQEFL
jgi:hypothetical protein